MKKNLSVKVHLVVGLLYGVFWLICILLSRNHVITMDNEIFRFIGLLLSVSYLLHITMSKQKKEK